MLVKRMLRYKLACRVFIHFVVVFTGSTRNIIGKVCTLCTCNLYVRLAYTVPFALNCIMLSHNVALISGKVYSNCIMFSHVVHLSIELYVYYVIVKIPK